MHTASIASEGFGLKPNERRIEDMLCDANVATELLGNRTKAQTYDQVASKWIPPHIVVRIGRTIRFKEDALREFIDRGGAKTKQEGENSEAQDNQVDNFQVAA
jgi:hypothetical protein